MWDHMKDALRRDWEQTKSDFTRNRGHELNQNAVDTVVQSIGWAPIPSIDEKTRETDPLVAAKSAEKAHAKMEMVSAETLATIAKVNEEIAQQRHALIDAIGEIRKGLVAREAMATHDEEAKIEKATASRDEATAQWHDAEEEVRYGYFVRSRHPDDAVWDGTLEGKLRSEWEALDTGKAWDVSSVEVHRGWDLAGKRF
jgi:hypothetical protein